MSNVTPYSVFCKTVWMRILGRICNIHIQWNIFIYREIL
jgi:hypothetical protein